MYVPYKTHLLLSNVQHVSVATDLLDIPSQLRQPTCMNPASYMYRLIKFPSTYLHTCRLPRTNTHTSTWVCVLALEKPHVCMSRDACAHTYMSRICTTCVGRAPQQHATCEPWLHVISLARANLYRQCMSQ